MVESFPLAELRNVEFHYNRHEANLFEGASFEVVRGEIAILAGPNGSGKSTLLGLLSGRLAPTAGIVRVFGKDPTTVSRAPDVGLITEPFHPDQSPLPVDLTVRQVFEWLRILDGVSSEAIERGWDGLGLSPALQNHEVRMLSKGERQRVMLLVTLLRRPHLVLADEPLEGLDRKSRHLIGEYLRKYVNDTKAGVLWVSHHLAETLEYADRLFKIENRQLIEEPSDRFQVRIYTERGNTADLSLISLHSLPDIVAKHLDGQGRTRLEIEDTAHQKEPK